MSHVIRLRYRTDSGTLIERDVVAKSTGAALVAELDTLPEGAHAVSARVVEKPLPGICTVIDASDRWPPAKWPPRRALPQPPQPATKEPRPMLDPAQQRQQQALQAARQLGHDEGHRDGYRMGWWWGLTCGAVAATAVGALSTLAYARWLA